MSRLRAVELPDCVSRITGLTRRRAAGSIPNYVVSNRLAFLFRISYGVERSAGPGGFLPNRLIGRLACPFFHNFRFPNVFCERGRNFSVRSHCPFRRFSGARCVSGFCESGFCRFPDESKLSEGSVVRCRPDGCRSDRLNGFSHFPFRGGGGLGGLFPAF